MQSDYTDDVFLIMLHAVVVKNGARHFDTWDRTVRHLGKASLALRSKLSLGHFRTSADLSGEFRPTKLMPKCPGSEVSVIHPLIHTNSSIRPYEHMGTERPNADIRHVCALHILPTVTQ